MAVAEEAAAAAECDVDWKNLAMICCLPSLSDSDGEHREADTGGLAPASRRRAAAAGTASEPRAVAIVGEPLRRARSSSSS